ETGRDEPVTQRQAAGCTPVQEQVDSQTDAGNNRQHREREIQHQYAGIASRPVLVFEKIHRRSAHQNDTFGAMRACSVSILSSWASSKRPNSPATKLFGNCSR